MGALLGLFLLLVTGGCCCCPFSDLFGHGLFLVTPPSFDSLLCFAVVALLVVFFFVRHFMHVTVPVEEGFAEQLVDGD